MRIMDASRWLCSSAFAAFFVLTGLGCSSLPQSAVAVLENADEFKIFALEPYGEEAKPGETVFHGHAILAQAEVKDANARINIAEIVNRGVRHGGTQAKCFNPRHGVHATRAGHTVDLLICYECSAVEVIEGNNSTTLTTSDVQSELDVVFGSVGVTRP